jgi:hypothetical protein
MVEISISIAAAAAHIEVKGMDKLWAFKGRLEIPLAHIRGVHADPSIARGWRAGIKAPGTSIPGVIRAGTFYEDGKRVFWDVHDPDKTIVIDLHDERYDQLIVEVADPAATVKQLNAALAVR